MPDSPGKNNSAFSADFNAWALDEAHSWFTEEVTCQHHFFKIRVLWKIAHQCPNSMPCCSVRQLGSYNNLGWKTPMIITNNPCKAVSNPVNNLMISLSQSSKGNFLPKLKRSFYKQISSEKSTTVILNPIYKWGFSVLNACIAIANLWKFWHQLRKLHRNISLK